MVTHEMQGSGHQASLWSQALERWAKRRTQAPAFTEADVGICVPPGVKQENRVCGIFRGVL